MIEDAAAYQAMISRDTRFDGLFFVGVTSTGIYCRPICPVKSPQRKNCRFFDSAGAAEKAGFRPCLRCRPELAPGLAPVDRAHRIAHLMVQRIDEGEGMEEIAAQFAIGPRQLRRIVQQELGVSPIELMQTRRLLLAKQLLTETRLPVTEIAFASGFSSLRRFNDAFSSHYRMPPTRLRKEAASSAEEIVEGGTSTLRLCYRPPYDWEGILTFLRLRTLKGVEFVTDDSYSRSVSIGACHGWIRVRHLPAKNALNVEFSHTLTPVLPALLGRLRNLFDLSARPDLINGHLEKDPRLEALVAGNPGLRVPGVFDGFELAVRAILGQQVTVKAATTLAGRFVEAFGGEVNFPAADLKRISPTARRVAEASVDEIARLGIVAARARCILAVAREMVAGRLRLEPGTDPETMIGRLVLLPGIGHWTAHYIAMRALRWPDAFPKEDVVIRKILGGVTAKQAEELSRPWRPWRGYAVLHLWQSAAGPGLKGDS